MAQKLLQEFRYPWEMLPLLHAIAKISKADFYVASAAINEGKIQILFSIFYGFSMIVIIQIFVIISCCNIFPREVHCE